MKTISAVVLCLALSCASVAQAGRLERHLLQSPSPAGNNNAYVGGSAYCRVHNGDCNAYASVTNQAINDAATSIASAYSTAFAQAQRGEDVTASSNAFAQAIARAYARIISSHTLSVYVNGEWGRACAYTYSNAASFATALSNAMTSAAARVDNELAQAAGNCFAQAIVSGSVQAVQTANYSLCEDNYGYDYIHERLVTVGYVQTIATAFSSVYVNIRDNNASAFASCGSSGSSSSSTSTSSSD